MTEDVLKEALTRRADAAPVRLDGQQMLGRVRRREVAHRRRALGLSATAVAVLAVAVGAGIHARSDRPTQVAGPRVVATPAPPAPGSAPSVREVTWGVLRFEVPSTWVVDDTQEVHPYPAGALIDGPFIGTLGTGPMCWSNRDGSGGCARNHGILDRRPTAGVVAWIRGASAYGTAPGGGIDGVGDPGSQSADVCPPGGRNFHAFRLLKGPERPYRVVVDGCTYGPQAGEFLDRLRVVAASIRRLD